MKGNHTSNLPFRLLLCIGLTVAFHLPPLAAQSIHQVDMINGDTVFVSNCHYTRGNIFDDGGGSDNYSQGFDGWAVATFDACNAIVSASYRFAEDPNTYIDIWDGSTLVLNHGHGTGVIYDTIVSGTMRIHIHCNPSNPTTDQGLNLLWIADTLSPQCHGIHKLNILNVANHSAIVSWNPGNDSVWLDYGNGVRLVEGTSYSVLNGLDSVTDYSVTISAWRDRDLECCRLHANFTTTLLAPPYCIDVTDLESPFVSCTSGDADNPLDSVGVIPGRHTVMTDPDSTDPVTGGQLHVVPPGESASLRLGNPSVGAEGEGIICQMTIDTNVYDILLLKYAAVLQVPDHLPASQPRFNFKLYDEEMHAVDPVCGAADFIASPDMDWNPLGGLMWKDWTTVGFNLSPYHGHTLNVVFTTRDCVGGAHFGYAYLVTNCFRKGISTPQCGVEPPRSLTAPPGFLYEWYTSNDTTRIVSTNQTVQVDEPGATYYCRMSYVENNDCKVHISVYAGSRFPLADFDYDVFTSDCVHFNVAFTNRSTVSPDGVTPSATGELCENAYWDFGNGQTSTDYNPIAYYDSSGTYYVTLISSISGDECLDTLVMPITLPTYHVYEDHFSACDSMTWWRTGETFYDDTVGAIDLHPSPDACDTLYILHLNINRTPLVNVPRDTSCWTTPYRWRDHILDTIPDTPLLVRLADTLVNIHGCDSVVAIDVLCVPKYNIDFEADADCHIKQYRLVAHSDAPFHSWSSSPIDPALNGHLGDTSLTLSPTKITTYTYHAFFTPQEFCPTTKPITLEPVEFPTALLRLRPEYMTLDHMEYEAVDLGERNQQRSWTMTEYLGGTPLRTLHPAPAPSSLLRLCSVVDSVVVELDVSNGFCHDTARGSIPLVISNIFAPNIFTPERPSNNLFQIIATGITDTELDIYNREGLIIFHTTDLSVPWDGTHAGRPCPQGAYAWRLRYLADDNRVHKQETIGTVLLIR